MEFSLQEIAEALGGEFRGDAGLKLKGISSLEEAQEGDISLITRRSNLPQAEKSRASAFIVAEDIEIKKPIIRVEDIRLAMIRAINLFNPPSRSILGIHPTCNIGQRVKIGEGVTLGAYTVVGDEVEIGDNVFIHPQVHLGDRVKIGGGTIIYPQVTIYERVTIGEEVIIHSGTVIGSDGFGFVSVEGEHRKIPQVGEVAIEDKVEIGSNVSIDRATLGTTRIGRGTKIDNLVQIGHNVTIGKNVIIVAQVGISGSVTIGDNTIIAGQVGFADHLTIGANSVIGAKSGVLKNLPPGSSVLGSPARPHMEQMRIYASLGRLPEIVKDMKGLEKRVRKLEGEK